MTKTLSALALAGFVALLSALTQAQSQGKIRVLSDEPLQAALVGIAEAFRQDSGHQVEYVFAASPVLLKRIAEGEAADVVIVQTGFVAELARTGKIVPREHPVIARAGFGLAARADLPAHDISTMEGFKQVLLDADVLIFNNRASGDHFATVLDRLNIAEAVRAKVVRLPPAGVFERVSQGRGNEIGVGTIPQIKADPKLRLVGPLPPEFQSHIVYAAAPLSNTRLPEVAQAFATFLASPSAKALFAEHGVD
jgi:molybdate transport system substrate-binding protein